MRDKTLEGEKATEKKYAVEHTLHSKRPSPRLSRLLALPRHQLRRAPRPLLTSHRRAVPLQRVPFQRVPRRAAPSLRLQTPPVPRRRSSHILLRKRRACRHRPLVRGGCRTRSTSHRRGRSRASAGAAELRQRRSTPARATSSGRASNRRAPHRPTQEMRPRPLRRDSSWLQLSRMKAAHPWSRWPPPLLPLLVVKRVPLGMSHE